MNDNEMTTMMKAFDALHAQAEHLRATSDLLLKQAVELERELARLARNQPKVGHPEALQAHRTQPTFDLTGMTCPRCGAAVEYRWSATNKQFFVGCKNFRTRGCRGSLTVEHAERRHLHFEEAAREKKTAPAMDLNDDESDVPF